MRGLLCALLVPLAAPAQAPVQPPAQSQPAATFQVDSKLALVRFQLSPKPGETVDLRADDIEIREDGVPQHIAMFEGGRKDRNIVPVDVALLFDCSLSVREAGTLNPNVFHRDLLDPYPNASLAIYAFSDRLVRMTGATRTAQDLKAAIETVALFPAGKTPLFEYITETMRQMAIGARTALRILIVFSDGESTRPGDENYDHLAIAAAQELGVAIYPVVLSRPGAGGTMDRQIESVQKFMALAKATGGETTITMENDQVLPRVLRKVASRVQFEYVAGYYPAPGAMRRQHEVEVAWRGKPRGEIVGGSRIVVH
jgi:VWFA-related protein